MSGGATTHILDDRGVRVRVLAQRGRELTRVRGRLPWHIAGDAFVLFLIGSVGFLSFSVTRPGGVSAAISTSLLLVVCIVIGVVMRRKVFPALLQGNTLGPTGGWLVFQGHCPACGYSISDLTPQQDGCAVCPECGGAWHADRWMTASRADERHKEAVAVHLLAGMTSARQDDRSVPLPWTLSTPPRWLDRRDLASAVRCNIEERFRAAFRRWGALLIVVSMIMFGSSSAVFATSIVEPHEHVGLVFVIIALGTVGGTVIVLCVFVVIVASPSAASLRRAWLGAGLCPNCGCPFAKDAKPQFDGCTACRECGRAWKR